MKPTLYFGSLARCMPQSLSCVLLHVIFSTKNHHPFLDKSIRGRMHAYLATLCRDLNCNAYRVGGIADPVHIVAGLNKTLSQSQFIEDIKKKSSKWVKQHEPRCQTFAWQRGYGIFSISQRMLDKTIRYVENQEEHHKEVSFKEEFRIFLEKYNLAFDEKYIWD
jgi:putative transposase